MSDLAQDQTSAMPMPSKHWLSFIKRYFFVIFAGNLIWEFSHLPLYTIWQEGTTGELVFAAVHCTGGDVLIALASLMSALVLFGSNQWPTQHSLRVMSAALIFGVSYTVFSEWLNIEVRETWAYSDLMPTIPGTWIGLSPLMQWICVPLLAIWWARQASK